MTFTIAAPMAPPTHAMIMGYFGIAQRFADLIHASEITTIKQTGNGMVVIGGGASRTALALTDGRSATQRAADTGIKNLALIDIHHDYDSADTLFFCVADQACKEAVEQVAGLIQVLGKQAIQFPDLPAMAGYRSLLMQVNALSEIVDRNPAAVADIDHAAQQAAGQPRPPLSVADRLGLPTIVAGLEAINRESAGEQYVIHPILRRYIAAERGFYPADLIEKARVIARDKL
jgi:3-hydroxybutyryl-CoA dehydrogenase